MDFSTSSVIAARKAQNDDFVFLLLYPRLYLSLFCRSDGLPFDEIEDVYLLDFVGPPGFVADIAPKVQRSANIHLRLFTIYVALSAFLFDVNCVINIRFIQM